MKCKLDWFSFTFPIRTAATSDDALTVKHIMNTFHSWTGQSYLSCVTLSLWQPEKGHGVFTDALVCPLSGIRIEWNSKLPYALCQLSGVSVSNISSHISSEGIAKSANGRATRIDLAVDMETSISPIEFTNCREAGHFKTSGFYTSETGETCYIGSRSGDRMARVYRYNPPHPRSHLLRAEIEYKGAAAKALCEALNSTPLTEVTLSAHLPFGWKHPVWDTEGVEVSTIQARPYDKSNDGSWKWLMLVAWPALCKAHDSGTINLIQLFKEWTNEIPF